MKNEMEDLIAAEFGKLVFSRVGTGSDAVRQTSQRFYFGTARIEHEKHDVLFDSSGRLLFEFGFYGSEGQVAYLKPDLAMKDRRPNGQLLVGITAESQATTAKYYYRTWSYSTSQFHLLARKLSDAVFFREASLATRKNVVRSLLVHGIDGTIYPEYADFARLVLLDDITHFVELVKNASGAKGETRRFIQAMSNIFDMPWYEIYVEHCTRAGVDPSTNGSHAPVVADRRMFAVAQ